MERREAPTAIRRESLYGLIEPSSRRARGQRLVQRRYTNSASRTEDTNWIGCEVSRRRHARHRCKSSKPINPETKQYTANGVSVLVLKYLVKNLTAK